MYEFLVKIMYELDYRKYTIEDLEEIKDILEKLKGEVLETRLKHIKEETAEASEDTQKRL